jgi:hypothetical protein
MRKYLHRPYAYRLYRAYSFGVISWWRFKFRLWFHFWIWN